MVTKISLEMACYNRYCLSQGSLVAQHLRTNKKKGANRWFCVFSVIQNKLSHFQANKHMRDCQEKTADVPFGQPKDIRLFPLWMTVWVQIPTEFFCHELKMRWVTNHSHRWEKECSWKKSSLVFWQWPWDKWPKLWNYLSVSGFCDIELITEDYVNCAFVHHQWKWPVTSEARPCRAVRRKLERNSTPGKELWLRIIVLLPMVSVLPRIFIYK